MLTVFGSIIIDNIFSVPALPQQGETILAHGLWVGPGGKGANQAVAAARTGHPTRMVGSVGTDGTSTIALDALRKHGVDISSVQTAERPTGSAAVMVDPAGANAIAVAPGANGATRIAQMTDALWQDTTTLLLQMEIPFPEIKADNGDNSQEEA